MQIRIGRKLGFVAALAVAVFASQSASAANVDLKGQNKTVANGNCSDSFYNSSETTATLTFAAVSANRSQSGTIGVVNGGDNIKVSVTSPTSSNLGKIWTFSKSCVHTGGTVLNGVANLSYAGGTYGFGTQPITINLNGATSQGGIRLAAKDMTLTNDIVMTGTGAKGYQSTQANCQGQLSATATSVTYLGKITAQNCGEISLHQGDQWREQATETSNQRLIFSGEIDATGTDVYLNSVTNAAMVFKNDFTAKRVLCQYNTAISRLGHFYFSAGHNFTFDSIDLAGHFIEVNGHLNEECILGFTPTAAGNVDNAVNKATYGDGKAYSDPEISKFTFGADQTINCVTGVALTATQAAEPGMVLKGTGTTLTLKCALANAECSAKVSGSLGLTLNATDKDNVQAFLSRTNDTTGALNVQKGVFKIGAGASFPNVKSVSVNADGTLAVDTTAATVLSDEAILNFESGAKLTIAEGTSLVAGTANLDGSRTTKEELVAAGILSAADADRLTLTGKMPPVYFYASTSVNIFSDTAAGWFKDRALTVAAEDAPKKSTTGALNVYVAEAGTYANKLPSSNSTFAGDVFQMGNEEKGKTCTMTANSRTYSFDSLWLYGADFGLNANGTLTLDIQNECKFFKTENALKFNCLYMGENARIMAFKGKYVSDGDVDVQCSSSYGSGHTDPSEALVDGEFTFKGDYTSFKGRWRGVAPSYGGGVDLKRKVYLCLEAESAFGDQTYIRHDAIVLGCGSVLCVGSDVTTTTNRGVSVYLSKAGQTAYIDTDKYGSVVLNAPVGYTTSSLKDATVTLEKIGENKLTLADKLSVKSVKVTEGSLKLARTATVESGVTIDVAAGAKLYYYQSHLDQGLVITGEGGKFLLSGSAIIVR